LPKTYQKCNLIYNNYKIKSNTWNNIKQGNGKSINEKNKCLIKKIEKDTHKKERHFTFMDCKNIVKIFILLKGIYRFNGIPVKILMIFFTLMKKS
jgi:hypothetical protein